MDMREFSFRNKARCEAANGFHHRLDSWSLSDWMTALAGEMGEAANIIKKLNLSLSEIVPAKFAKTSKKVGYQEE